ncbi:MAG TPA: pitrilysin family protein [Acidobacteriota bacterium]
MTCPERRKRPKAGFLLSLVLAVAGALPAGATNRPSAPADQAASELYVLDNGLRVCLMENRAWPLVHVVAAVDLGSKNETAVTNGLSHILEHYVLFRGTNSRTADEISRDIRRHGAYFNAHTGLDIAQFELTLPSGQDEFALGNQRDILFNLKIDRAAMEAEKEVILKELNQQEDDPLRYATSLVYQRLFAGHPYALPIAGTRESISRLTVAQMESYYKAYFTPANVVLAVVGDFSLPEMKEKVARIFGPLPRAEAPPGQIPSAPSPQDGQVITLTMDISQAYCVIGLAGPDYNHPDQYAMDLLTEILGRGVNPMLNSALSRNRVQAEGLYMSYVAHRHGGVILITLILDPGTVQAAQRETLSFLRKARTLNFSADEFLDLDRFTAIDYLRSAKNQIRFSSEKSQEFGLNLAISLARHMILSSGSAGDGYLKSIGRITSSDLRRVAAKYLGAGKAIAVSVIPSTKERRR